MGWTEVEEAVQQAKSIAWDGCHKIYILLDDEQTKWMERVGYRDNLTAGSSRLFTSEEMPAKAMLTILREWFDNSCGLRFISSVKTVDTDPNDGFTHLISQFEEMADA